MGQYVFHVLHNARPEYVRDVIDLLSGGEESSYEDLLQTGSSLGLSIGSQVQSERMLRDILQPTRDMGFVAPRRIQLTQSGRTIAALVRYNPSLFAEMIHFAYYSTWDPQKPAENCFSWSYRQICNYLWEQVQLEIDKSVLASNTSSMAIRRFQVDRVSFSSRSVDGVLHWLKILSIPVIQEQDSTILWFSRRAFCPPELFIMAIDFVYWTREIDYGVNLLLSDENRDAICQVCLLEPERFDRVLDYTVAQFDYLHKGIGGGWGQYLALDRAPMLEEFI